MYLQVSQVQFLMCLHGCVKLIMSLYDMSVCVCLCLCLCLCV